MTTKAELSRDADAALEAVDARMIEAEKDARFVEAVRYAIGEDDATRIAALRICQAHWDVYDLPCTASAKTERNR